MTALAINCDSTRIPLCDRKPAALPLWLSVALSRHLSTVLFSYIFEITCIITVGDWDWGDVWRIETKKYIAIIETRFCWVGKIYRARANRNFAFETILLFLFSSRNYIRPLMGDGRRAFVCSRRKMTAGHFPEEPTVQIITCARSNRSIADIM